MFWWFYDNKRYPYNFLRVQTFRTYKNQTSKWQRSWVQEAMAEFTGKWKPLEHILCCCAFELFWGSLFSTMADLNLWCKLFIVSLHDQNTKVPQLRQKELYKLPGCKCSTAVGAVTIFLSPYCWLIQIPNTAALWMLISTNVN